MPTINELAKSVGLTLRKLRKIDKALGGKFLLLLESADPIVDSIRQYYRHHRTLTVAQMVALIADPGIIERLEPYSDAIRAILADLGNPTPAPFEVAAYLDAASRGEEDAVLRVVNWLKAVLPADRSVTHAYPGVRLLLGVPPEIRQYEAPRLNRVMANCRKHPDFADWWYSVESGKRRMTIYAQPGEYDL